MAHSTSKLLTILLLLHAHVASSFFRRRPSSIHKCSRDTVTPRWYGHSDKGSFSLPLPFPFSLPLLPAARVLSFPPEYTPDWGPLF